MEEEVGGRSFESMKEQQGCHEKTIETINQNLDKLGSDVQELRQLVILPTKKEEGGAGSGSGRCNPPTQLNENGTRSIPFGHFKAHFPAYNGKRAPDPWLKRCGHYFDLVGIESDAEKFQLVGLHMEDEVFDWYLGYKKEGQLSSWELFEHDIAARFGPPEATITYPGQPATTFVDFHRDFNNPTDQCIGVRESFTDVNGEMQNIISKRGITLKGPYQDDVAHRRSPFVSSSSDTTILTPKSDNNSNTVATLSSRQLREKGVSRASCDEDNMMDSYDQEHHWNPFLSSSSRNNKMTASPSTTQMQHVSRARWNEDMMMGEIIEQKGQIWATTGIVRGGRLYCAIEEILFLAERGALVLLDAMDDALHLGDIFKKLSDGRNGCSWESFLVYKRLKSLGYVVGRHGVAWTLKHDKECSSSGMQANDLNDNGKSLGLEQGNGSSKFVTRQLNEMHIAKQKLDFDVYLPNSQFKKSSPGDPFCVLCIIRGNPPTRAETEQLTRITGGVPLKFCHVDHWLVNFFSYKKVGLPMLP